MSFLRVKLRGQTPNQTLSTARIMLLLVIVAYPLIGYLYNAAADFLIDPPGQRFSVTGILLVTYALTYISPWVIRNISLIIVGLYYMLIGHVYYMCFINDLYPGYIIGLVITLGASSIIFTSQKSFVIFLCALVTTLITTSQFVEVPQMDLIIFGVDIIVAALVSYVVFVVRAQLDGQLSLTNNVINQSQSLILVFNQHAEVDFVSPAVQRMLGHTGNELLRKGWWTKIHGQQQLTKAEIVHFLKAKQHNSDVTYEDSIVTYDGSTVWLRWTLSEMGNDQVVAMAQDITNIKENQQKLEFFAERLTIMHEVDKALVSTASLEAITQTVLSNLIKYVPAISRASFIVYDTETQLATVGGQVGALLRTVSDMGQMKFSDIHKIDELAKGKEVISTIEDLQKLSPVESKLSQLGLRSFWTLPIIYKGQLIGSLNFGSTAIHPFTEADRQTIREMAGHFAVVVHQKRLQSTIQEQNQQLLGSNDQLTKLNGELRKFAHVISHDLKAPLRGIASLTSFIKEDNAETLSESGKEQLDLLSGRVDRMYELINGILNYSKVSTSELQREVVNVKTVFDAVKDALDPPEHIRINLLSELPVINGDGTRIYQLFQNLISNAIKYSDKAEGLVEIGCEENNSHWLFFVRDNGPGIEARYHEKIFQLFQTLNAKDDVESTGVGLTIVKKIIEIHGGTIWLQSVPKVGSTFFFTLEKIEIPVSSE